MYFTKKNVCLIKKILCKVGVDIDKVISFGLCLFSNQILKNGRNGGIEFLFLTLLRISRPNFAERETVF